ncbi:hypothetical protein ACXR2U_21240 [Jatrophihabitans sp. YIM 134969]
MTAPLLPCGRDPLDVADHATHGTLDEHESTCPFCAEVVAAARLSAKLGTEAAAVEVPAPSRDLVSTVMRSVRTELRTAREIPLDSPDGAAFATDHVVAAVLRDALDAHSHLIVSSCRIELLADGLGVRIEAVGRYPDDLRAEATGARDLVIATLLSDFGLVATAGVDVAVVDLIEPVS